ncbi:MAG: cbb3-type cytochrome c oxidase subunit I [Opitutae bacterium]|nr:cbb3-type cytochrome c oxidase subunit I [Opitutae bacterium]
MNSPDNNRLEQQEIDASAKWPVLTFLGSALCWLVLGGALQLGAALQLHTPAFLGGCEWFTYGRLAPAAQNALVYGWGMNAAFGFGLWLMARLSASALRHGGWLFVAAQFWNLGITLGVLGILTGASTSFELLELPRFVTVLLLVAYALIGLWAVSTFCLRNTEHVYVSQWYLFGAAFWFPWLYTVAQVMLFQAPVRGALQPLVNAWYVNGLYGLWFVPVALAAAYYFLPKILGRPLNYFYLPAAGFWCLVVATAFSGGSRLIGGPVPSWVATLGTVANFVAVPAVVMISMTLFGTLAGRYAALKESITLRFVFLGLLGFVAASLLNFALSLRSVAVLLQFTLVGELRDWLLFYGCFSTMMFGAAYFIVPRLTGRAWRSGALVRAHCGATALGLVVLTVTLLAAGWQQGKLLNDPAVPFADLTKAMLPWFTARSVALMLLAVGHLAFFVNFCWSVCPFGSAAEAPAEFHLPPAMSLPAKEGHA